MTNPNMYTLKSISEQICQDYGVTMNELRGEGVTRAISRARSEYYYRARTLTAKSWNQIARYIRRKSHATAIYGARAFEKRMRSGQ